MPTNVEIILQLPDEEGVVCTWVPALDYASTYGANREEAIENTKELILGYVAAEQLTSIPIVPPVDLRIIDFLCGPDPVGETIEEMLAAPLVKPSDSFEVTTISVTLNAELPAEPIAPQELPQPNYDDE